MCQSAWPSMSQDEGGHVVECCMREQRCSPMAFANGFRSSIRVEAEG